MSGSDDRAIDWNLASRGVYLGRDESASPGAQVLLELDQYDVGADEGTVSVYERSTVEVMGGQKQTVEPSSSWTGRLGLRDMFTTCLVNADDFVLFYGIMPQHLGVAKKCHPMAKNGVVHQKKLPD